MGAFFRLVAAGPFFFVSAWVLMLFAGITASDVGIRPFGYVTSMVVTIGLWLTMAPAVSSIARVRRKMKPKTKKE
jgi:type VI protein secretion system component VasK